MSNSVPWWKADPNSKAWYKKPLGVKGVIVFVVIMWILAAILSISGAIKFSDAIGTLVLVSAISIFIARQNQNRVKK